MELRHVSSVYPWVNKAPRAIPRSCAVLVRRGCGGMGESAVLARERLPLVH
jgi:hypothetical protein